MCKQKHVFLSTGLSVKQIPKKMEKPECWVVRWSQRNKGFTDKKRGVRLKVRNKTAKTVLKKAMYKTGNPMRQLLQQLGS